MRIQRPFLYGITILAAGFFLLISSASAQNIFGSIVGTVSDSTGAALSGATVTVTNGGTGEKRNITTDGSGNYQALSLVPGQYSVDVDSAGFKHFSRTGIDVVVDQAARVNVAMSVGEQTQQITVTSAAPIMQTENASLGQVVQGKAVTNIPLNGRNVLALVALVPGVVPQGSSSGNLTGQNVFAAGNYQIGGGNANQGSVLLDGAPVNTSYGNTVELVPDQDVIQEFRVQTNNNTAEFGMYTGGVINMATKSGSNAFHGTAYEFLRNTNLDANDFFAKRSGAGREAFHQNQFGGNIGGPIKKDKYFFFGDYQGFRQSYGHLYLVNVPTPAELNGDFSAETVDPIYDPLTTCSSQKNPIPGNPACTPAQLTGNAPMRQQFSYNGVPNVIDPARFSSVAKNLVAFPDWAAQNQTGQSSVYGPINNFSKFGTTGGNNDQYTIRGDQTLSEKQRLFERYTHWKSSNTPSNPYGNGLITGDPISPEAFTTQQGVVGDTYIFNPTTIADIHVSYLRWNYQRTPGLLGYDETKLGWPSYMGQISALNDLTNSTTPPKISLASPTLTTGGTGYIFSINNNYVIAPTFTKIIGNHTIKAGADLRRLEMNYFQNNSPGGVFTFDNIFTSANPSNTTLIPQGSTTPLLQASGNSFASFLLGYVAQNASQTVQIAPPTYQTLYYQGYYVQDTWNATPKLTLTLGLRYEIPGVYVERHNNADTFNPTEINPVVGVPGAFDLVASPQHPARGVRNEHFNNFSPRIGVAYRLDDKTVLRTGWGKFVIPSDLQFPEAPLQAGVNFLNNIMVQSTNGNLTPANTFDNPYPGGLLGAPHRNPDYQQTLLGGNAQALYANEPNGATYQWNVAVQRELPYGIALEAAYAGLHGSNLPVSVPINQVPDKYLYQAAADPTCEASAPNCFLNQQATNNFYGKVSQGVLQKPTVLYSQTVRPFPQYGSISNSGHYAGVSNYNALELKLEKRFASGGTLLGAYTFSKLLTNAEYLTSWLDSTTTAGFQDYNTWQTSEYSLSSFDSRQRLVVSYVYGLPIGKGGKFLANASAPVNAIVSGWGVNGVTTFQEGYPLGLTMATNNIGNYVYGGSTRPNVVSGMKKKYSGSIYNRLGGKLSQNTYFNVGAFAAPAVFQYGDESRTDNALRTPGIANYDMALYKNTPIHENVNFELRVEAFNLFNRVQFGSPNSVIGSGTTGQITTDLNQPRLLQIGGRFNF
ncbi:TonB-dependent receptor [Paracidobacterium acidisoli]|nr:TonB-dependent receptor [Paracidobacterium acidisoli]MBT9330821.1 TonB-dependent receptor [Paracidobacterium acidisoli]